MINVDKY